ncbi:MAG: futalosine hydrolase [Bacillota bacterium]
MNSNIIRRWRVGKRVRILVVTAVAAERQAVWRGLQGNPEFDVVAVGVGPVAAAANTAKFLATAPTDAYGLVVCAGLGGGFPGVADVGSLVVANEIVAADLGVETPDGFAGLDALGFGATRIPAEAGLVHVMTEALGAAGLPVVTGPVLTVSTVTGTAQSAAVLAAKVPGAAAEAMEGYGVAFAACEWGLPVLEIRAVSNLVGPRDRVAWRVNEALGVLEAAGKVLSEVLKP